MTDKVDELIKEIAAKHHIAVGRNDPILILQTINEKLMLDTATTQENLLSGFKADIEEISHRWSEDAKQKAQATLNASVAASKTIMHESATELSSMASKQITTKLEVASSVIESASNTAKTVSYLNITAAIISVIAALIVTLS